MRNLIVLAIAFLLAISAGSFAAADQPAKPQAKKSPADTPRSGWTTNTPGGPVWLNPGEAYEHHSGLVRRPDGTRTQPIRRSQVQHPATLPGCPNCQPSPYRPQYPYPYRPSVPNYTPTPWAQPYFPPPYYAPTPWAQPYRYPSPFRYPAPNGYDLGPYQAPVTKAWGVNPADIPRDGDAPLAR
ncbi:MAG: hypothetical protein AAF958_17610 [Planctomycetota bacterium]